MRLLLQPRVLSSASLAAALTALACYPRFYFWQSRPAPFWYLETMIFLCSLILWGFVFAWHTKFSGRPVFIRKVEAKLFIGVTLLGIFAATVFHLWLDSKLRALMPKEYPADLEHWCAFVLFALAVSQLFQIFAPFAWLMRLFKNQLAATCLTAAFGAFVLAMKLQTLTTPLPEWLLMTLLVARITMGFLAVAIYLRGGVFLVWWWTFLFEARHLLDVMGNP